MSVTIILKGLLAVVNKCTSAHNAHWFFPLTFIHMCTSIAWCNFFSVICAPKVWGWSFINRLNTPLILYDISGRPQSAMSTDILFHLYLHFCMLLKTTFGLILYAGNFHTVWIVFCMVMFGSCMEFGDGPARSVMAFGCAGNSLLDTDLALMSLLSFIIANCGLLLFCKWHIF